MPLSAEDFRKRIEALERIEFPAGTLDAERTIQSSWIKDLFPEPQRVCTHPIRLKGAIIEGELIIRYATAPYEIEITDSDFTGRVSFAVATIKRVIDFSRSRFRKSLIFSAIHAENDLRMRGCICDGEVDLLDATIGLVFNASGTRFRGPFAIERAKMTAAFFRPLYIGDVVEPTRFDDIARFHDMRAQYFDAVGVQFAKSAQFHRMTVTGITFFRAASDDDELKPIGVIATRFGGETTFRHARFGPEVSFAGAEFMETATFHAVRVEGRVILEAWGDDPQRYPTRFKGKAEFTNMNIGENLGVGGCQFAAECRMNRMKIGGSAYFSFTDRDKSVAAVFGGAFSFEDTEVVGYTDFRGVTFRGPVSFIDAHLHNTISFTQATWTSERRQTVFEQDANFYRMRIEGDFWCEGADFRGDVDFTYMQMSGVLGVVDEHDGVWYRASMNGKTRFDGMRAREILCNGVQFGVGTTVQAVTIDGAANFEAVNFLGDADFRSSNIGGKLSLESARIHGDLLLRDARAAVLVITDWHIDAARSLDARGFTFDRIDGDVRSMLRRQNPYDRRIYEDVERFLRQSGNEDVAGAMYVDRQRRETQSYWRRVRQPGETIAGRWLMDLLLAIYGLTQDLLFRYGVRPLRLVAFSILVVATGTWVFSHQGAIRTRDNPSHLRNLSGIEALGYSARVFMPVGDLPSGAEWIPTEKTLPRSTMTYAAYATIERLLGLVLVPLGIASITGVLVRKR